MEIQTPNLSATTLTTVNPTAPVPTLSTHPQTRLNPPTMRDSVEFHTLFVSESSAVSHSSLLLYSCPVVWLSILYGLKSIVIKGYDSLRPTQLRCVLMTVIPVCSSKFVIIVRRDNIVSFHTDERLPVVFLRISKQPIMTSTGSRGCSNVATALVFPIVIHRALFSYRLPSDCMNPIIRFLTYLLSLHRWPTHLCWTT